MSSRSNFRIDSLLHPSFTLAGGLLVLLAIIGCRTSGNCTSEEHQYYQDYLTAIEYPEIDEQSFETAQQALSERPPSVTDFQELDFEEISLEQAIQMALTNSRVLSKIGGQVVSAPAAATSIFDPAIQETNPTAGVEGALSAFDTRWNTTFNFNRGEQKFNNPFFGGGSSQLITNSSNFVTGLSKQTGQGATLGVSQVINYNRNNAPVNRFASSYDMLLRAEFRQAILRGSGSLVNQVAGPNPAVGFYNGVLIARINQDLSLSDFEASLRDLVREVERSYWELYYTYRNLDNLIAAKESAREVWEKRELRKKIDRPDDEAQARQQYFSFQGQVETALAGVNGSQGLFGAERELRRLLGMTAAGTRLLRPSTQPVIAQAVYDWDHLQMGAMEKRVELRRQQWVVKQRELEFLAAKNLNKWQLDFVANYGWRGFGDNLAGSRSRPEGSALEDFFTGDLDDWNMGFEFGGPIGKRQTYVAVRNAELQLSKARAVLKEQQRQVVLNLNRAFVEVDRSYAGIRTNYNAREAIKDELRPKQKRFDLGAGDDDIFFLLDAQQRAANTESAFVRSIVDYNLALLDIAFESGKLLSRYNIQLAEGPWTEGAYANAASRDLRFSE
ncbi:MAG: TolC family protein [Planctomycetota bacterium]|nr:TolC family protein [Planctomycetota bacterium]